MRSIASERKRIIRLLNQNRKIKKSFLWKMNGPQAIDLMRGGESEKDLTTADLILNKLSPSDFIFITNEKKRRGGVERREFGDRVDVERGGWRSGGGGGGGGGIGRGGGGRGQLTRRRREGVIVSLLERNHLANGLSSLNGRPRAQPVICLALLA
jgi:hypothetical protein